jgi:inorganic pyrophosphatase
MPISLDLLLNKAILDLANNENYDKKIELVELIYKRYSEIKELNEAPSDYYPWLLERIEEFKKELLKN